MHMGSMNPIFSMLLGILVLGIMCSFKFIGKNVKDGLSLALILLSTLNNDQHCMETYN